MSHRPYPNTDRAYHQLNRHADETGPLGPPRPVSPLERALIEGATAAARAAAPVLASLVAGMRRGEPVRYVTGLGHGVGDIHELTEDEVATLRKLERPAGSEEKTT